MLPYSIDELVIPATLDAPGGVDFARFIDVANEVEAIGFGTADLALDAGESLPYFHDAFQPRRILVARVDGENAGSAEFQTQIGEESDTAWLRVDVLPEHRGHGIGTALANEIEAITAAENRAKAVVYQGVQPTPGEQLDSPTGFGRVPRENRDVRFMLARGYSFEQVERLSRLALPVPNLAERLTGAIAATGADYVVHTWNGSTPERWREDMAVLGTRMSTDAPSAGLEEPEDVWTVERIMAADERGIASGIDRLVAAIEHVPTNSLVGFTMLAVPGNTARAVSQYATLVLREHRGHRLGMLLKVANLEHLDRVWPGHPSVMTFNAEENRYMLDVNEAVGFVGIGFEAAWRKDL